MKKILATAALVLAMSAPVSAQGIPELCLVISETMETVQTARNAGVLNAGYFIAEVNKMSLPSVITEMMTAMITVTYQRPPTDTSIIKAASYSFCMETIG